MKVCAQGHGQGSRPEGRQVPLHPLHRVMRPVAPAIAALEPPTPGIPQPYLHPEPAIPVPPTLQLPDGSRDGQLQARCQQLLNVPHGKEALHRGA